MKNKFLAIAITLFVHSVFLFGFDINEIFKKENFSKKKGPPNSNIKVTIKRDHSKVILKKRIQKNKQKILERKSKKVVDRSFNKDGGSKSLIAKYYTKVRSLILKYRQKNRIARKLKLKGVVTGSFNLVYPNKMEGLKIFKTSHYKPLDESAILTIRSIDKFPQMPKSFKDSSIPIIFEIIYE